MTPEEQLAAWCAALSTPLAVRMLTDVEVSGPYSVSELMARLGASREVVRRALEAMERQGLVRPVAFGPGTRFESTGDQRWVVLRRLTEARQ